MTQELGPSWQRWTAIIVFIVLPLALLPAIGANIIGIADLWTHSEAVRLQLERYEDRLAGSLVREPNATSSTVFVNAPSRSLAEADLQRRLVALIESASAQVVESSSGIVQDVEADHTIEIRVTLDGDNADLLHFLHSVETGLPLMTITDLAVRRLQSEENDLGSDPRLRIDAVVRARWKALVL
ncbi:type II secretion system protein GspM [Aureimonas sp. AU40]|uniref:type II secretion system protein GspM n=1 Tax=Aureimonas sp. AU40 TaxID=1637747 RepID=UPI000784FAFA|nr:type II secretion system protein GspM [Aureimonas sp. AU40]